MLNTKNLLYSLGIILLLTPLTHAKRRLADDDKIIHLAVENDTTHEVSDEIDIETDINETNPTEYLFSFKRLKKLGLEGVQEAIANGANVGHIDNHGNTALHMAAIHGCRKIAKYYVTHCLNRINIDAQNNNGDTALHLSTHEGHIKTTRQLLAAGADRSLTNNNEEKALDLAEEIDNPILIEELSECFSEED